MWWVYVWMMWGTGSPALPIAIVRMLRGVLSMSATGPHGGVHMRSRTSRIAVAALAATALTLGTADATRTVRIASRITIESHGLRFHGKVKSENSGCKYARHVSLYRVLSDGHRQRMGTFVTGPS